MAYYDALKAQWATLSGTTALKLAEINALTVAGPTVDVPVASVIRYLAINAKLAGLLKYAASPPATAAGTAAAELAAVLNMPAAPDFVTSATQDYQVIQGMLTALAGDTNSGITSSDVTNLMALAQTTIPWWQAHGYTSPFTQADLDAAGGLS